MVNSPIVHVLTLSCSFPGGNVLANQEYLTQSWAYYGLLYVTARLVNKCVCSPRELRGKSACSRYQGKKALLLHMWKMLPAEAIYGEW